MAESTKIEWADATFNPWEGCRKVSPACKFCYAENRAHRFGKDFAGTRTLTSDSYWRQPLKWNRKAAANNTRLRVFCASLSDIFEDWQGRILRHDGSSMWICPGCATWRSGALPDVQTTGPSCGNCGLISHPLTMQDVRRRLFELVDATPNLDWLVLTKRPENIQSMILSRFTPHPDAEQGETALNDVVLDWHRPNLWLGTSVENQEYADNRIPELLRNRAISQVLFLSCEPLLGPVDLSRWMNVQELLTCQACGDEYGEGESNNGKSPCCMRQGDPQGTVSYPELDWIIAGGESGPNARPSHPDWFRSLRDQCNGAGVPFHFKQWGSWEPAGAMGEHCFNPGASVHELVTMNRVGKKAAGRILDGVEHNGFPATEVRS